VPVFAAPGNHELNLKADSKSCPKAIDGPDPSGNLLRFWTTSMGQPFGVFRYGNSAFLAVNTDDVVPAGVKLPKCEYNGYVGPDQLAALEATLAGQDPAGTKPAYVITGGAGAPLTRKATPATGGYHHYLVVRVEGAKVTATVVKME
jgi:hypothetical protein